MGRLTDLAIRAAKATSKDQFLSDGSGLYLRVTVHGARVWVYRYKNKAGATRWFDLGTYPAKLLTDARAEAANLKLKRRNGIDPIEERERELERQRQALAEEAEQLAVRKRQAVEEEATRNARISVRDLFDIWTQREISKRKDGGTQTLRAFTKDVFPTIGDLAAVDVRKGHIAAILDAVLARGGNGRMAACLLSDTRQMFKFAVDRDYVDADPTASIRRNRIHKPTERERVLSTDEIRTLRDRLPQAGMAEQSQLALFAMLATCCRVGELCKANLSDINIDDRKWVIPAGNSKNAREHNVHLSDFAAGIFTALKARADELGSEWILPARNKTDENDKPLPVCEKSLSKQVGDRQRPGMPAMSGRSPKVDALVLPGGKWTPHDLRRTGATMMAGLGIAPSVIERCLNHVEPNKMQRIYQRHDYAPEMQAAWDLLGERLALLLRPHAGNIVILEKNAA